MAHTVSPKGSFSDLIPAKEVGYSSDGLRCIYFFLKKGQKVELHTSPHWVWITVLDGRSLFFVGSEENTKELSARESILYEPREPHGFLALEDSVLMALVIRTSE